MGRKSSKQFIQECVFGLKFGKSFGLGYELVWYVASCGCKVQDSEYCGVYPSKEVAMKVAKKGRSEPCFRCAVLEIYESKRS